MNVIVARTVNRLDIPLDQRTMLAVNGESLSMRLFEIAQQNKEPLLVLSTCERFEVYTTSWSMRVLSAVDEAGDSYFSPAAFEGRDALRHLFSVAAGMESRLPGDAHILGQIRVAFNEALRKGTLNSVLRHAVAASLRSGRRVRSLSALGALSLNYATQAILALKRKLPAMQSSRIAVIGCGTLGRECVAELLAEGCREVLLVGRHAGRTEVAASIAGVQWTTISDLESRPCAFDAAVVAVGATTPIVTVETLRNLRVPLLLDLGAAPTVDARVDRLNGVEVIRLEDITNVDISVDAAARATELIEEDVRRYMESRAFRLLSLNHHLKAVS